MASNLLGRTNLAFPRDWFRLVNADRIGSETALDDLIQGCLAADTVLDISTNPGFWGGQMRGTENRLMIVGGSEIERAPDEKTAFDLIQAHLIQTLSAIGREWIDFYFLAVRRNLEEYQINGALQALDSAREEGHIKFLGIAAEGPPLAVQGLWQFRDAFEVILLRDFDAGLASLAKERRVGIVCMEPNAEAQVLLRRVQNLADLDLKEQAARP